MKIRAAAHRFALGYPATNRVTARRLRKAGDVIRRSGQVVLVNGTNAFTVDVEPFKKVSLASCGEGAYSIVGHALLDDARGVTLASFGNETTAQNAYAALLHAHAGMKVGGGSKGGSLKFGGGLAALFLAVVAVSAFTSAPMQPSLAATSMPSLAQQQYLQAQADAQAAAGAYNQNEPSLEDLANGNYQFSPKLKAPTVEMPTLNCAQR